MRRAIRPLLLLPLLAMPAAAQERGNPIPAIRADNWPAAQAQAGGYADPVAQKLVLYYRLLAPGAATAAEIAGFMHDSPDWPNQALLERRRQDAIAADPDDRDALQQCDARAPTQAAALLRCARALSDAGRTGEAEADARRAWIAGLPDAAEAAAFLHRWSAVPGAADDWARFQHLAWHDHAAAARQLARLDPPHRKAGEARLALQKDMPNAEALLAEVPPELRDDPGLVLDHARFLRRTDRLADAVALWMQQGATAQSAVPDHAASFWAERNLLARKLLQDGNAADAYALVSAHGQSEPEAVADAEFLAGFIALRKLHDPAAATHHFARLARSHAAITQGRAQYWLGRAAAAAGQDPKPAYAKAAAWPVTFYGQLAALAGGETPDALAARIRALRDPAWSSDSVLAFTGHEVLRAAAWLVAWGDPHRARAFLLRMDELAPDAAERTLTAAFATKVGLPDMAVFVARRMGRDGLMLPQAGWPMPFHPPLDTLDPAVALGIMRQESSFDIAAVSPSGARGLMQLMPFTAADVAKQLGVRTSAVALTSDPDHNMQLGSTYLQEMLERFGGSLPLAVAAYNAGPHRVDQWLAANGDPRGGAVDMLDWLEEIPVGQTRNYVQRVLGNVIVYRAKRGEATPTLVAQWAR
jgi:soluble lytic murein transglycosylase